jgi:putative ABC transport system permease protein
MFYEQLNFVDQSFFGIFDFKVLSGNSDQFLTEPYTAVITKSTAIKIFGTADAVGRVFDAESDQPYTVTGVLEDFPSNSHLDMNILFSIGSVQSDEWYSRLQSDWNSNYFIVYYLLKPTANVQAVEASLTELVTKNRQEATTPFHFWLQPLTDIHFHSAEIRGGYTPHVGEIYYVYIFAAIGLFILIIALVNYVNLSTALSTIRGKEIGVKKVAGATKGHLVTQFIMESTLVVFIAVGFALALVSVLLPAFNSFTGKSISAQVLMQPISLMILVVFTIVIGLLSGGYPAFYLSRLQPIKIMKGFSKGSRSSWMRSSLVVFQFTLSITLIIATLTAYQQIDYIRNKNLGFDQQQLVILDINSGGVRSGYQTIKNELSNIPGVSNVSVSSRIPGEWKNFPTVPLNTFDNPNGPRTYYIGADEDFISTFKMQLVAGRNFSASMPADSSSVLINETAAKVLGITEPGLEAVIPSVNMSVTDVPLQEPFKVKIIGIVKDFHFQSLHQKVAPMVIAYRNNPIHRIDYFTVRVSMEDMEKKLATMQEIFYKVDGEHVLEANYLDQRLAENYQQDAKRGQLFGMTAIIAIVLACLGLFSLASFNTAMRTKEIGVRKVLGASVAQVTLMLSSDYIKLVGLGFILAVPFSYWVLQSWLSSFAYRIEIGWLILATACLVSIVIALVTVGYKSIRAAIANPVNSLRNE